MAKKAVDNARLDVSDLASALAYKDRQIAAMARLVGQDVCFRQALLGYFTGLKKASRRSISTWLLEWIFSDRGIVKKKQPTVTCVAEVRSSDGADLCSFKTFSYRGARETEVFLSAFDDMTPPMERFGTLLPEEFLNQQERGSRELLRQHRLGDGRNERERDRKRFFAAIAVWQRACSSVEWMFAEIWHGSIRLAECSSLIVVDEKI